MISVGYVLFEQIGLQGQSLLTPHVLRAVLVVGLAGPTIAWVILTIAKRMAVVEAEAQRESALRNRELAALNVVWDEASHTLDLEDALAVVLEKIVRLMDLHAGEIRMVEGDHLVPKAYYSMSESKKAEGAVRMGECLCGRCAHAGSILTSRSLTSEPTLADSACSKEGFRSIICVPMKAKDRVVGVILLASRSPSVMTLPDLHILAAIGERVATAIENARLLEQERRRAMRLEVTSLVGQRMASLLSLDTLLGEVARLIREKFGYYHVSVFLVDEEANDIVLKEASGPNADLVKARGQRFKVGQEGITGWVAQAGETLMCNDVSRDPRYYGAELLPETRAELAVPLRVGNRTVGVLDVQSKWCNAFDQEDVSVLHILGNQVGIAIENARLFQETKHRYEAMAALHEISLDMISQLDTPQLLEALLRRGTHLLGAHAGMLFLYDREQGLIRSAATYNTWREWAGVVLRLEEGVAGQVIRTGKAVIVNDYDVWSGRASAFEGASETRIVGVPLKWEDRVIGAIDILNNPEGRPFDNDDVWLLGQFADLASIAIKTAELHMQIKRFSQELEQKVDARTDELSKAKEEIAARSEQLRQLLAKTIRLQEDERARIARDMHDGVIQLITAARLELQALKVVAGSKLKGAAQEKMLAARELLEEMEKEIRHAIYDLHPPILDAVGLGPALQSYIKRCSRISGINCHLEIIGRPRRLPVRYEGGIYRMLEEALSNVAAHAEATEASVVLDYQPSTLSITVSDNGRGFDQQQWQQRASRNGHHLGLLGMMERVKGMGGCLDVDSQLAGGTHLTFRLPIERGESEWSPSES